MCFIVKIPDKPFEVCMECLNPIPPGARYVWTPSWPQDRRCDFDCTECTPDRLLAISTLICGLCFACVCIACLFGGRRRAPEPVEQLQPVMVVFREDVITQNHIRIKIL